MSTTPDSDGLAAMWAPLPGDIEPEPVGRAEGHPVWRDADPAEGLPLWRIDTIHAPAGDHHAWRDVPGCDHADALGGLPRQDA